MKKAYSLLIVAMLLVMGTFVGIYLIDKEGKVLQEPVKAKSIVLKYV